MSDTRIPSGYPPDTQVATCAACEVTLFAPKGYDPLKHHECADVCDQCGEPGSGTLERREVIEGASTVVVEWWCSECVDDDGDDYGGDQDPELWKH